MTSSVLITGCKGGIGESLVAVFSKAGWRVIGIDRTPGAGKEPYAYLPFDLAAAVRSEPLFEQLKAAVRSACSGAPLSCLINNAAVQHIGAYADLEPGKIAETLDVNVLAPMLLAQAFASDLEESAGSIINIGSVHAQATKREFAAYATSKAAIHGLTRALAVDLGPKIRVNTLAPAATDTEMMRAGFVGREEAFRELADAHPLERIATPEEIARIALFLAGPDAGFVTGASLFADGGVLSRLHDPV